MYPYGAKWTAADISENQIEQAKILSKDMDIDYYVVSTEDMDFSDNSFDVITACRGIGASLSEKEISMWEQEYRKLLEHIAPDEFDILHYGAIAELKRR